MSDYNNPITPVTDNGKTTAIVSYITFIGWLVAYFALYPNNKTQLASFHLRQSLLLNIVGAIIGLITRLIWLGWAFSTVLWLVSLGLFVLAIIGIINAANNETRPLPLVGEQAQRMFPNI